MMQRTLPLVAVVFGSAFLLPATGHADGGPSYLRPLDPTIVREVGDRWYGIGHASADAAGKITVGDRCGFGTEPGCSEIVFDDSLTRIFSGSGYDGDVLMNRTAFYGDVRLSWTGCIGKTYRSQHQIGLSVPNRDLFTGAPGSFAAPTVGTEFAFATVWLQENAGKLTYYIARDQQTWTNVADGQEGEPYACHDYSIERKNNEIIAKVGQAEVYRGPSLFPGQPLMAYVSNFDSEITLENVAYSDSPADASPPVITPHVTPAPNGAGWNNSAVTVSWSVADPESAFTTSGCQSTTVSADTALATYTCSATSAGGTSQASVSVRVDMTPPTVACPADVTATATTAAGAVVSYSVAAPTDAGSGLVSSSVVPGSGSQFPLGTTPVNVSATDLAGNVAGCAFNVKVTYAFGGFAPPIGNGGEANVAKAGASVPVKFSLGGNMGLGILAAGSPSSAQVPCDASGPVSGSTAASSAGGSKLAYDPVSQSYTYVWKTDAAWRGQCRIFTLGLNDGTVHTARFAFK